MGDVRATGRQRRCRRRRPPPRQWTRDMASGEDLGRLEPSLGRRCSVSGEDLTFRNVSPDAVCWSRSKWSATHGVSDSGNSHRMLIKQETVETVISRV